MDKVETYVAALFTVFIVLIFYYKFKMDKIDRQFDVHED